jgi:hypothetical protein
MYDVGTRHTPQEAECKLDVHSRSSVGSDRWRSRHGAGLLSVSQCRGKSWQRQLDRVQPSTSVTAGVSIGSWQRTTWEIPTTSLPNTEWILAAVRQEMLSSLIVAVQYLKSWCHSLEFRVWWRILLRHHFLQQLFVFKLSGSRKLVLTATSSHRLQLAARVLLDQWRNERAEKWRRWHVNLFPDPEKTTFQLNDNFEPSSGGNMVVGYLLTLTSLLLTVLTFPLSLFFVIKVGVIFILYPPSLALLRYQGKSYFYCLPSISLVFVFKVI